MLSNHEFDLKVPPEFFKGKNTVKGKLLDVDPATGRAYVRYRSDILHDPPSADANANAAIQELKDLLEDPTRACTWIRVQREHGVADGQRGICTLARTSRIPDVGCGGCVFMVRRGQ